MESILPDNIKERALSVFRAAVSEKYPIKDAIEKVQKEALSEIETVFKGQRFKVRYKNGMFSYFAETFTGLHQVRL